MMRPANFKLTTVALLLKIIVLDAKCTLNGASVKFHCIFYNLLTNVKKPETNF